MFSTKSLVAKYCILSFIIFSILLDFVPQSYAGGCSSKQSVEAKCEDPPKSHLKPPLQVDGDPRSTVNTKSRSRTKGGELSKTLRRRRARKAAALRRKAEERLSSDEEDSRQSPVKHMRTGWSVSSSSSEEHEMRRPATIGNNSVDVLRLDSAPLDDERKTVPGRRGVEIPVLNLGPLYPSRSGSECSPVPSNNAGKSRQLGKTHSYR